MNSNPLIFPQPSPESKFLPNIQHSNSAAEEEAAAEEAEEAAAEEAEEAAAEEAASEAEAAAAQIEMNNDHFF